MNELDKPYFYELKNGEVRTSYLDVEDGLCKSSTSMLASYSKEMSCAEIMLNIESIYITDELDEQAIADLVGNDVYSVYCKGDTICYNDTELEFSNVYNYDNVNYSTSLME